MVHRSVEDTAFAHFELILCRAYQHFAHVEQKYAVGGELEHGLAVVTLDGVEMGRIQLIRLLLCRAVRLCRAARLCRAVRLRPGLLEVQADCQLLPDEVENVVLLDLLEFLDVALPEGQLHLEHLSRRHGLEVAATQLAISQLAAFRIQANRYLLLAPRKPLANVPRIASLINLGEILILRLEYAGACDFPFHNAGEQDDVLVDLVLPVGDELAGAKGALGEEAVGEQ